jgi:hypothetical protein
MGSIDLSSRVSPGYVVVALRGELDVSDAAGIERALAGAAAPGSRVIVEAASGAGRGQRLSASLLNLRTPG